MKKVKKTWETKYKPLKVYKNDLKDIIEIAKEYEQCNSKDDYFKKVEITVGDFELEDITELDKIKSDTVEWFRITLGPGAPFLTISNVCANMMLFDDEDNLRMGIANRIDGILRKRQGIFQYLVRSHPGRFILGLLLMVFLILISYVFYKNKLYHISFPILFLSFSSPALSQCFPYKHSTIIMSNHGERPSFFQRNKDTILVAIIVSIATTIISVSGTLLVQHLTKEPEVKKPAEEIEKKKADTQDPKENSPKEETPAMTVNESNPE